MKNYAGTDDKDDEIAAELQAAGIEVHRLEFLREARGEVKTAVRGSLHGWSFERLWYYWSAQGPGIELSAAMKLHASHGQVVRVDGHCGCPSPLEQHKGLATGFYHVDTAEGLKALADTIKAIVSAASSEVSP